MGIADSLAAQPALKRDAPSADFCSGPAYQTHVTAELRNWRTALKDKRYADLDRFFGGLQKRYADGEITEQEIDRWFQLFDRPDPSLTPLHRDWIKAFPKSYAARIAIGRHFASVAYASRGVQFVSGTSDSQFEQMKSFHELALRELSEAESLSSKPILAVNTKVLIARYDRGDAVLRREFARAEAIDPENVRAKGDYALALQPKWGGSMQALLEFQSQLGKLTAGMTDSQRRWIEAKVRSFIGDTLQEEGRIGDAENAYLEASGICPASTLPLENTIWMDEQHKRYRGIVVAATRYLEVNPASGWAHSKRGRAYYDLGEVDKSFADYTKAAELGDPRGANGLAWFYENGRGTPRDLRRAAELYRMAVAGNVDGAAKSLARVQDAGKARPPAR